MSIKKLFTLILSLMLAIVPAAPSYAAMTSEEKEARYRTAVLELETYLESGGKSEISLAGIGAEFEALGGYMQSRPLLYYTQILELIAQDDYGYELDSLMVLLEGNSRFEEYLSEALKDSAIMPVEYLLNYVAGRRNEYRGDAGEAMAEYQKCKGFFDADDRYTSLRNESSAAAYEEARRLLDKGDFAGAYFTFGKANRYNDSEDRRAGIVTLLEYTPADESDNPGSVTGLRLSGTDAGRITLAWDSAAHARGYEVACRKSGTQAWTAIESTRKNTATVSGLETDTFYDFQVTAVVGKVRTKSAELTGVQIKSSTPTPMPGISVEVTCKIGFNRLDWNSVPGAGQYRVYRSTSLNGNYDLLAAVDGCSYTDDAVNGGTTYYYRVEAVFPNGQTVTDRTSAVAAMPTPTALPAPGGLNAQKTERTSVLLTWNSVPFAQKYRVMVKERSSSSWREGASTSDTTVRVIQLSAGTEYQFKVIAVNGDSQSESGIITVWTAAEPPKTPTPTPKPAFNTASPYYSQPVDIGVPDLKRQSFSRIYSGAGNDSYDMNIYIYWVQVQLRALGYYNGDLTGLFDRETNNAVKSLMQNRGVSYSNRIDQTVVNAIAEAIGNRRVAVKYGGFYHGLDYLTGSPTGNMKIIWSNVNHDRYGPNPNTPYVTGGAFVVQTCLAWLGYYSKGIDGMFGSGTDESVQRFEAANGFTQKGWRQVYVTYGEVRKMLEMCDARGYDVSRLDFGD